MRVANKDARKSVNNLDRFTGSNIFAVDDVFFPSDEDTKSVLTDQHGYSGYENLYIVYSYGYHFPMYIYDRQAGIWIGSKDSYSSSTTRHQSQCRPSDLASIEDGGCWLNTADEMKEYIRCGSLMKYMEIKAKVA
tara:strand:- start:73 stop:477 length:405 start_codon:yes stop_codon:yes gene_type:complete